MLVAAGLALASALCAAWTIGDAEREPDGEGDRSRRDA
jgi:hypothetical protein